MVIGFTKYPKIYRILYDDEPPRTDKRYLTKLEVGHLLDGEVIVEEKVDGAVSGIRWNDRPIVQCRSHVISENELDRQFKNSAKTGAISTVRSWRTFPRTGWFLESGATEGIQCHTLIYRIFSWLLTFWQMGFSWITRPK